MREVHYYKKAKDFFCGRNGIHPTLNDVKLGRLGRSGQINCTKFDLTSESGSFLRKTSNARWELLLMVEYSFSFINING